MILRRRHHHLRRWCQCPRRRWRRLSMILAPRFQPDFTFIPRVTNDQTFIENSLFGVDRRRMLNMRGMLAVEEVDSFIHLFRFHVIIRKNSSVAWREQKLKLVYYFTSSGLHWHCTVLSGESLGVWSVNCRHPIRIWTKISNIKLKSSNNILVDSHQQAITIITMGSS